MPGGGSEPEFLLVFCNACSISESAVAVVSDSSSEDDDSLSGGGGETFPADSLRGSSSGDCGGVWILTRFSFLPILKGAVYRTRQSKPSTPTQAQRTYKASSPPSAPPPAASHCQAHCAGTDYRTWSLLVDTLERLIETFRGNARYRPRRAPQVVHVRSPADPKCCAALYT